MPVTLAVFFFWQGSSVEALAADLSRGGMQLKTSILVPVGARMMFHFGKPGQAAAYRVDGEVAWSNSTPDGKGLFACGLKFLNVSAATSAGIDALLGRPTASNAANSGQDVAQSSRVTVWPPRVSVPPLPASAPLSVSVASPPAAGPEAWAAELASAVHADTRARNERRARAAVLFDEAKAACAARQYEKASALLEDAVSLAPDVKEIVEELARVSYVLGDVARAAELFDRAMRLAQETT